MHAASGFYSFISGFNSNPYIATSCFFTNTTPQKTFPKTAPNHSVQYHDLGAKKNSWMRYRLTKRNNKEKTDTCEIWGSYSCDDEDPHLLGCYDMAWQPRQHGPSTATCLMHYEQFFDVLLWVFPQLIVSFLPDMLLNAPTV